MKTATAQSAASVKDRVSPQEWQQRVDLAAAYRLVAHYGWDDMIFTHISARVPGPEHHFLINPYGLLFDEITASSLLKIDLEGNAVMESEYKPNAAGFTIHSAIHEAREDAKCVMHLHTVDGTAVSAMEGGLQPLNQTSMIIVNDIATHEYEGIAFNLEERPRLVNDLGAKNLMLLWNHGTLAIGGSVAQAFLRMYIFERACSMQVRSMAAAALHRPDEASLATTREQGKMFGDPRLADKLAWPALLRKLDRIDRSYAS